MSFGEKLSLLFLDLGNSFKKNAPTIGVVGGITAVVAGTGFACWATLKSKKVVDNTNSIVEANKKAIESSKDEKKNELIVKENKKEILKAVGKVALYYTPAVISLVAGITAIAAAHIEQSKRLGKALATSSTLSLALAKAQQALKDAAGEEEEERQRLGGKEKQKYLAQHVDEETGEVITEEEELLVVDPNLAGSPYAFYCDETTTDDFITKKELTRDDEISIFMKILSAKQDFLNNKLRAYGSEGLMRRELMLSEVLEEIGFKYPGIPRYDSLGNIVKIDSAIAKVTGWVYDTADPNVSSYVDLRARVVLKQNEHGEYVKTIVCDPNVDGCVIDHKYSRG